MPPRPSPPCSITAHPRHAITHGERYNKIVEIWSKVTDRVSDKMFKLMEEDDRTGRYLNPIYIMADSGARGSKQQIRQLSGMRGRPPVLHLHPRRSKRSRRHGS